MPSTSEWTQAQALVHNKACVQCGKVTTLRLEPFTWKLMCKSCWESLVFDEDD